MTGTSHQKPDRPLPDAWKRDRSRSTLLACLIAVIAAILGFLLVDGPLRDGQARFWYIATCAALLAGITAVLTTSMVLPWRRPSTVPGTRSSSGEATATCIEGARPVIVTYYLFMVCLLVFLLATPVLLANISFVDERRELLIRGLSWLMPVVAIFPAGTLLAPLLWRKRFRRIGLGLGPDGIYHWSWFGERFIAWDWIRNVEAVKGLRIRLLLDEPHLRPQSDGETPITRSNRFRRFVLELFPGYLDRLPS